MNHREFAQAKRFIFADIEREIHLAYASDTDDYKAVASKLGIPLGGGNFLAAIGLLSYTEFAGKLKYNRKKKNGRDHTSENFNLFFDDLGPDYKQFRALGVNVYDIFRCGLVHEYYVKTNCTIYICRNNHQIGIGKESGGKFFFVVETYFDDFRIAFNQLESQIFGVVS